MPIAITGASGKLGRRTAELLTDRLDPSEVVLLTRSPDRLSDFAQRGAIVRPADFDDPRSLPRALDGVERMLLISAADGARRVAQHRAAITAAKGAGVRHVIYTSMANPADSNPAVVASDHRATEQALTQADLDWTLLRNNVYAELMVGAVTQAARMGRLPSNTGGGRTAYVSREDCAAAAAAVLADGGHEHAIYEITGPEALSATDLAELASELAGKRIPVADLDDEAYADGLIAAGVPEPAARLYTSIGTAARQGFLQNATSAVTQLTGRPPRTLRDVLVPARQPATAQL